MTSPLCPDASVVLGLVTGFDRADAVRAALDEAVEHGGRLVAPALIGYEVANGLHRYVVAGSLTSGEAREALDAALGLGIEAFLDPTLHTRALAIAAELGQAAAYDAHYLAVAEAHAARLLTVDRQLAGRAERLGVPVVRLDLA